MSTAISVLGGVGLFLLGMTVMTGVPEGTGGLGAAHGARQSGGNTAARLLLGRPRHAPGTVVQRDHHDDDRAR